MSIKELVDLFSEGLRFRHAACLMVGSVLPSSEKSRIRPSILGNGGMWDASYMKLEDKNPLQRLIAKALAQMPEVRDFYDKRYQERANSTGKPLYDIERGKSLNPNRTTVRILADLLRQPEDLFQRAIDGEEVDPLPIKRKPVSEKPSDAIHLAPDQPPIVTDGALQLRRFDLSLSMGDGSNIDDYAEITPMEFDANLLRALTRAPTDRLAIVRGDGDSMMPTLINDDMVLVDTLQRDLKLLDRIWAISLYGAGGIKRLNPAANGKIEVISDNPLRDNRLVDAKDVRILGRVIWIGRRV